MPLALPIVSKFDPKGVNDAKTGLDRLGGFAKGAGALLAGAFVGLAAGAGAFAASSVKAADESWRIGKGLENAVKNASVFGTAEADIQKATTALQDHSTKLAELTGIDDEVLDGIKRTFLAIPELAGQGVDGINRLAEVSADVAAGTGKDIESIGSAFIKIAGDEETALSKLLRAGVVFTDEQKAQYEAILETGDQIAAQTYLVDQLATTYDGAAESMASPLGRIAVLFENLQETVGAALMPALEEFVPILAETLAEMVADPEFQAFLEAMTQAFIDMIPKLQEMLPQFMDFVQKVLPLMIEQMPQTVELLSKLIPILEVLIPFIGELSEHWSVLVDPVKTFNDLMKIFNDSINQGTDVRRELKEWAEKSGHIFQPMIDGLLVATAGLKDFFAWWREVLGLPPINTSTGAVTVREYQSGGLRLSEGGIVGARPGGTLATIGEAGQAEAVIPLDRLDRMMGGTGGGATYNVVVNGGLSTSAEIGRAVVDAIKKFERVSGPVFAGA